MFTGGPAGSSNPVRITVDRDMGSAARDGDRARPVNLLTGNYTVSDTDASVDSFGSDLTITRTYNTRDAGKTDASGLFGQGWTSGLAVEGAGVDYTGLTVVGSLVQLALPDGESIGFTRNSNGTYTPEVGAEDLSLIYTAGTATYTLKDLDGTVVTFTKPSAVDCVQADCGYHAGQ